MDYDSFNTAIDLTTKAMWIAAGYLTWKTVKLHRNISKQSEETEIQETNKRRIRREVIQDMLYPEMSDSNHYVHYRI